MPAVYELRCLPQGTIETLIGSRGNYYEYEDGSRIDVHSGPAWCRSCDEYTDGESIESLDEIDKQLADLDDPGSEFYAMCRHKGPGVNLNFRRRWIAKTIERRRWRERRESPPRCLICGSTEIIALLCDLEIPNPRGAGVVVLTISGLCSTSFNEWFFTPEGERIPRDTKPTYWALPV